MNEIKARVNIRSMFGWCLPKICKINFETMR